MENVETNSGPVKPKAAEPKQNLVRCKICGFVERQDRIRDVCPACGVKATLFEPFTENFAESRRRILSWHLHPVVVHLPQAFSFLLTALLICMLTFAGPARRIVSDAILVMVAALPPAILGAFLTGILDGRTRFRKLSTPYLRIKLAFGSLYFVLASATAVLVFAAPWTEGPRFWIVAALSAIQFAITVVLGRIGADIACARMPG